MITQKELKQLLHYNPDTGVFIWLRRDIDAGGFNTQFAGKIAGTVHLAKHNGKRYIRIRIVGKVIEAHRLAYLYMTGDWPDEIDHANGNGIDNCWSNISFANRLQNARNQRLRSDNTSGVSGITWMKPLNKYRVRIGAHYLGVYANFDEAVAVRQAARIEHNYHPNHGTVRAL